jgi:coniferyl-aldehyde dehydrogenase
MARAKKPEQAQDSQLWLNEAFDRQKQDYFENGALSYDERMGALNRLYKLFARKADDIARAMDEDFGGRSRHEALLAELFTTQAGISHIRKNLKNWMEPEKRSVNRIFFPASAKIMIQPLGVVGVIAPWNYPFYLAMMPLATAIAAGNRVMLKPSEITPRTAELMKELMGQIFLPEKVFVATGGPEVGSAFTKLPLDHLLFTGSTALGRVVMEQAAKNLTPVTLELGGKSPALVAPGADLSLAADHIAAGKFFNAGQTCVAPDFVLVQRADRDRFVEEIKSRLARFYSTIAHNPDYTAIVSQNHYQRLTGLVEDAKNKGANIIVINPAEENLDPEGKKIAPTLVLDPTDSMRISSEEIFGPILPIVEYETLDEAIRYINERPRPLALYVFSDDDKVVDTVLSRTVSGGACVNETILQVAQDDLPFGGVGESGMGAYHAKEGFLTFSHRKGVFVQPKLNAQFLLRPPYTKALERIIRFMVSKI